MRPQIMGRRPTSEERLRRRLWNIYAWPMTLFIAAAIFFTPKMDWAESANALISIPSLIAIHLHIWNKRVLPAIFWKYYAFSFLAWEAVWLLVLVPLNSGETLSSETLVSYALLLPYGIALFRYAFRNWEAEEFA